MSPKVEMQTLAYTVISQTRHFEMQKIHNFMFRRLHKRHGANMLNGLSLKSGLLVLCLIF